MRINKLRLSNYRQFRNVEIDFHKKNTNDLNILIGENGVGKTNILNAINWCLYGDEPHLSRNSQQLPIINLNTIERADINQLVDVIVDIHTEFDNDYYLRFKRKASYSICQDSDPVHHETVFELHDTDGEGNTNIYTKEDAMLYLDSIFPERIREFFFFDGEKLDQYFRESTAQNIRNAVFKLSKLNLLENELERKLDNRIKFLEKKAGKLNPEIEYAIQKLEKEEKDLEEIERIIEEAERQATTAKLKVEEYEGKLRNLPDVEKLENERKKLKDERKKKEERCSEKINEKNRILLMRSKAVFLYPIIEDTIKIIKEKEGSGEIPPTIEPNLLHQMLEGNICMICGQVLDEDANKKVQKLLEKISLSSVIAHQLGYLKTPLIQLKRDARELESDIKQVTRDVKDYQADIENLSQRIANIDNELSTYNKQEIKNWHQERKKFEVIHIQTQQNLGNYYNKKKNSAEKISQFNDEFDKELQKEDKAKSIKQQLSFCVKALNVASKTREDIMRETRQSIETETEKIFFELTWKHRTFEEVNIKPNYDISLIHSMGYDCLGSLSAGERELLALSFFLALHKVSGFHPPILIDTPVARISGDHRENFGKILSRVSHSKQVILLFTPAEYSPKIAQILNQEALNRYRLNISSDEKFSKVEEL